MPLHEESEGAADMEKNVEIALLFSFYKNMLTEKQADTIDLYYNEDLSLAEIAAEIGISRQGVYDNLRRAEAILYNIEEKLGLAARFLKIKGHIADIDKRIKRIEASPEVKKLPVELQKAINEILAAVLAVNDME